MDYSKFNVEDFASNDSFIDWVNQSDPEAVKYWDLYLSTHPEIRDTVEKARVLVLNLKQAEKTEHDAAQVESMWRNIERSVETRTAHRPKVKTRQALVMASVLIVCAFGVWLIWQRTAMQQPADYYSYSNQLPDFVEEINKSDEPRKVTLQDGSTVMLAAKSSLKYKVDYQNDSTRSVFLLGEAFFEVSKNPYKPFIVHSNELFVQVLGTSFRVSAPENKSNVIVSVKTGKVSVYTSNSLRDKKGGVILLPNQQVNYKRKEQSFEKTLIEAPEIVSNTIKPNDFVFENTPIAEVFAKIESAYGIEIVFNEETMKNCYLTVPLGSEPMLDKLKIICQTIGASYEVIDANIVINSSGCK
jgi:transmembrane sensor